MFAHAHECIWRSKDNFLSLRNSFRESFIPRIKKWNCYLVVRATLRYIDGPTLGRSAYHPWSIPVCDAPHSLSLVPMWIWVLQDQNHLLQKQGWAYSKSTKQGMCEAYQKITLWRPTLCSSQVSQTHKPQTIFTASGSMFLQMGVSTWLFYHMLWYVACKYLNVNTWIILLYVVPFCLTFLSYDCGQVV